jgi:hypothetical protein
VVRAGRTKPCDLPATRGRVVDGAPCMLCTDHAERVDADAAAKLAAPPTCVLAVVHLCERWVDEQLTRACGEPATTTRRGKGEDVPLCAKHAADFDDVRAWAGSILGIAELTGENPADVAERVGPRPGKSTKGGA